MSRRSNAFDVALDICEGLQRVIFSISSALVSETGVLLDETGRVCDSDGNRKTRADLLELLPFLQYLSALAANYMGKRPKKKLEKIHEKLFFCIL